LAQGQALFERSCVACHGADGRGTRLGPPLVDFLYAPGRLSDDAFFLAVHRGVRQRNWKFGDMPPFTDVTPDEVRLIVAYVRDLQKKAGLF
jgi:mono/diheme cytochrome c family protein